MASTVTSHCTEYCFWYSDYDFFRTLWFHLRLYWIQQTSKWWWHSGTCSKTKCFVFNFIRSFICFPSQRTHTSLTTRILLGNHIHLVCCENHASVGGFFLLFKSIVCRKIYVEMRMDLRVAMACCEKTFLGPSGRAWCKNILLSLSIISFLSSLLNQRFTQKRNLNFFPF